MIKYVEGSLFQAPHDAWLVHACNARGVWGSGIAEEMKNRYPDSFLGYYDACHAAGLGGPPVVGKALCLPNRKLYGKSQSGSGPIICLVTSKDFGPQKDDPTTIKVNTTLALNNLLENWSGPLNMKFASNKFNSGLFAVPWEQTEEILNVFVKKYSLDWTVYTGPVRAKE